MFEYFYSPTKKLHCRNCYFGDMQYMCTINASFNTEIPDHASATTTHLKKLNENKNNTSIAHINLQALMSTFDKFSFMLHEYQFNIIALSEI